MIANAVAGFLGAFAALVVIAEVQMQNKLIKYLVALLAGALLTVILAAVLAWMLAMLGRAA